MCDFSLLYDDSGKYNDDILKDGSMTNHPVGAGASSATVPLIPLDFSWVQAGQFKDTDFCTWESTC